MVVKAAGPAVDVAADLHTRLDEHSAIRLARDLEQLQLMWLEEPVPPENIDAMREITRATSTPICAGENLYLRHGFRDLIEKQAVDIIMPDIPKCGGLSRMPQDRQHGGDLLHALRAAQRLLADRHDGLGACLRHGAELPGAGVPLAPPRLLVDDHRRAATSSRTARSRSATGPASGSNSTRRWRRRTSIPARPGSSELGLGSLEI